MRLNTFSHIEGSFVFLFLWISWSYLSSIFSNRLLLLFPYRFLPQACACLVIPFLFAENQQVFGVNHHPAPTSDFLLDINELKWMEMMFKKITKWFNVIQSSLLAHHLKTIRWKVSHALGHTCLVDESGGSGEVDLRADTAFYWFAVGLICLPLPAMSTLTMPDVRGLWGVSHILCYSIKATYIAGSNVLCLSFGINFKFTGTKNTCVSFTQTPLLWASHPLWFVNCILSLSTRAHAYTHTPLVFLNHVIVSYIHHGSLTLNTSVCIPKNKDLLLHNHRTLPTSPNERNTHTVSQYLT